MKKVAVIGGGITGLSAAHRLQELCPNVDVDLFESTNRLGGVLHTEANQGFLVEHSADMFTTKDDDAINLCKRIGFDDQLIGTNSENKRAFIAQGESLVPVPKGLNLMSPTDLEAIKSSSILSAAGKERFLAEENVPVKKDNDDESLKSFAVRRFGMEAYEKIIQPLVGGIYTADPEKLSLRATLNQYLEMEANHGSVIGAVRQQLSNAKQAADGQSSGARYHLFLAPKNGMKSLVEAISNQLFNTKIQFGIQCRKVNFSELAPKRPWELVLNNGTSEKYDAVILGVPANQGAKLLRNESTAKSKSAKAHNALAESLSEISYASSAIVVNGFRRNQMGHELNGFGFVVPLVENRNILAGSFSSIKFAGRAAEDHVLTRTFVGGGCQPELLDHDDNQIAKLATDELSLFLSINGPPVFQKVVRWNQSMPQYHLGHLKKMDQLDSQVESIPGLEIAGKSYRGVGIPACIKSAESAAERIASFLN